MRRVSQQHIVEVDQRGIREPDKMGDCLPACLASLFELPLETFGDRDPGQKLYDFLATNYPGVTVAERSFLPTPEPPYHPGFWIAGIQSPRFNDDCHRCSDRDGLQPDPPFYYARADCPWCKGTGFAPGWHAIVMEGRRRVWDPLPNADWDAELVFVNEMVFVVSDPSKLSARTLPRALS